MASSSTGQNVDLQRIPTWDGKAETLDEYQAEVELLALSTREEDRKLLGPRPVQALPKNTTHRKLALRLSRVENETDSIVGEKGPDNLIKAFQRSLGKQASSDVVDKVFSHYYDRKTAGPRARRLGQTIGLHAEHEEDAYQEMEKSARAICPDLEDLDLIPDELRGIIGLVNANLDPSERARAAAGLHDWNIESVIEKLKYAWADKEDDVEEEPSYFEEEADEVDEADIHYEGQEVDKEDLEALEAYAEDAEVHAQDAHWTFTETKRLLAEAAKNRSGYFPVIGIGQIPEKQFKDQKTINTAKAQRRPPKGKGKGIKCLICQGPHRAVDCPKRGNTGNDGNNMQMAAQGFVDAEDDVENNYGNEGNAPEDGQAGWVHEEMVGYAIIDTGASKSMIGIDLAAAIQHPVALVEDDNKLRFDLVEAKSPMLLGLDYLEKAGADLIKERSAL
ncbi:unnamed protein product, partial [Prorocentrum cordatum]